MEGCRTAEYMSPELLHEDDGKKAAPTYDPRATDVWAAGTHVLQSKLKTGNNQGVGLDGAGQIKSLYAHPFWSGCRAQWVPLRSQRLFGFSSPGGRWPVRLVTREPGELWPGED